MTRPGASEPAAASDPTAASASDPELAIPDLSLVVLVGASGSGKSTLARRLFRPTQVLSSDACRALVADDEADQAATPDAFEVLHAIASVRLRRGRLTVVDATNVQPAARAPLVELARAHDVLPVAIVLDVPEAVCAERNRVRTDRDLPRHALRRQHDQLRRSLRGLQREGFRSVHVLTGAEEVDAAAVRLDRLYTDRREEHGPFDVIGDVHGCRGELEALLVELGYELARDDRGRPAGAHHPGGRRAAFVGDLVDRGPDTPGVLRLVMGMVAEGVALCVPGNHEDKLLRALRGRKVQVSHGLGETLDQLAREPEAFRASLEPFLDSLISHAVLDGGRLVIAHAGMKEAYQGRASRRVRAFALYGETTGETDELGLPVRLDWARDYRGRATVLYGHTPVAVPQWVNDTLCLDTGCVFGGRLTALRWPERALVSVPAERVWYEPVRPLPVPRASAATAASPAGTIAQREDDVLDVTDVLGRRVVETRLSGRVTVREDQAAAAIEVMSRFAADPRWLRYLPPTMAPCATSDRPGLLEHPREAFAAYRKAGVAQVICEEKHMGSRAVVVLCGDEQVAAERFGVTGGATGAVVTRTGRPFFTEAAVGEALLARVRDAVTAAGLWEELRTGWLLLDAELLPWSAKAEPLLIEQYAPVGAAARTALPAAVAVLEGAAERGLDVGDLLHRQRRRLHNAEAYTVAYRRYVWPTDGLAGVRLAPFQVLAGEGRTFLDADHGWHLAIADRLAAADPELLLPTRSRVVDATDPEAVTGATDWWEALTAEGSEGMVVKPFEGAADRRVQPGVKCRGREYLRIIYGPDYTEPEHLDRLRERGLGRKRSLALREHALGVEALERHVRGEPLWRVHECVFAVLALESDPVDPRL